MLHGAGGSAEAGLQLLLPYTDEYGLLLYGPQSAAVAWDVILGGSTAATTPRPAWRSRRSIGWATSRRRVVPASGPSVTSLW
jgi:hypothetical protein